MLDPTRYDPDLRAMLEDLGLLDRTLPRPAPQLRTGTQALAALARSIGRMVANRRRAMGITQLQLAYAVGTSQGAISRIERGHYRVSLYTLNRVAWALDCQFAVGLFELATDLPSRKLVGALPGAPSQLAAVR